MDVLKRWYRRRAAKKLAARLPAILAADHGRSEFYTAPQIEVAFAKARIAPSYIDLAYAEYLDFEAYAAITSGNQTAYDADRALFRRYLPFGYSSAAEPAPVNEYIRQRTGIQ